MLERQEEVVELVEEDCNESNESNASNDSNASNFSTAPRAVRRMLDKASATTCNPRAISSDFTRFGCN